MKHKVGAPKELLQAQKLAHLTDSKIAIPSLGISLGLDFIVGLIPVVGDLIMLCVSLRIVAMAKSMQLPRGLRLTMLGHIVIDYLLGLIPLIGDLADLFYKSNQKNVRIMEKWWVIQHHQNILSHSQHQVDEWHKSRKD
jgi:hypothetical protein